MTIKKVTTTTTTTTNKVANKKRVRNIKEEQTVVAVKQEEESTAPAWNDEEETTTEPTITTLEEDKDYIVKEEENIKVEEEETDKVVKKAKVENSNAWEDEEDTNGMKFRNKSLLTVVPEWAKIKQDKSNEEKEEDSIFNSKKKLINNEQFKFLSDTRKNVLRSEVSGICFSGDGNVIFMTDNKGTFKVFPNSFEYTKKFDTPLYQGKFVDFSIADIYFINSTNEVVVTGTDKEYYYTFDILSEKITKRPLRSGKNYLKKSAMSTNYFSISDSTGRIMMISNASKTIVNELRMPSSEISAMGYSSDGSVLFVASEGNIYCFNVESMSIVHKFRDYGNFSSNAITEITCSLDGNYFVTGSESGIINSYRYKDVLESTTPVPLKTIKSILHPITRLQFSPNSTLLLAASKYDTKASKIIQYPSHKTHTQFKAVAKITSSTFSPNSEGLIIGDVSGSLLFYRASRSNAYKKKHGLGNPNELYKKN